MKNSYEKRLEFIPMCKIREIYTTIGQIDEEIWKFPYQERK